jgi:hypothetical protein
MIIVDDDDSHSERTHLYFSSKMLPTGMDWSNFQGAELKVRLRPTYLNGLRAGTYMSLLSLLTSWILFVMVGVPEATHVARIDFGEISKPDSISIVAILLLGLTLPIGILIRQDEHPLTKVVQGSFRARCFLISALMILTALAISLGIGGTPLYVVLLSISLLTTLLHAITLTSSLYSRHRIRTVLRQSRQTIPTFLHFLKPTRP